MSAELVARVEQVCAELLDQRSPITFAEVAARTETSKATLYRRTELRSIIEEHRTRDREAHTLSGLVVQIDQLRHGLEAVAARVRRHEELLRSLRRPTSRK
jgi:hypothetical protein